MKFIEFLYRYDYQVVINESKYGSKFLSFFILIM